MRSADPDLSHTPGPGGHSSQRWTGAGAGGEEEKEKKVCIEEEARELLVQPFRTSEIVRAGETCSQHGTGALEPAQSSSSEAPPAAGP